MNGVDPHAAGLVASWTFDGGTTDATSGLAGVLGGDVRLGSDNPTPTPSSFNAAPPPATPTATAP